MGNKFQACRRGIEVKCWEHNRRKHEEKPREDVERLVVSHPPVAQIIVRVLLSDFLIGHLLGV